MLYDPNQSKRVVLRDLRNWLVGRPSETEYVWSDCKDCLLCRYFGMGWYDIDSQHRYDAQLIGIAHPNNGGNTQTYGAALARCDQVLGGV